MSLLVWMPLIKDIKNYGLSDVTITNTNVTLDTTDAMFGGCGYFNGSARIQLSLPAELTSLKNTTVCGWIKGTGCMGGISHNLGYTTTAGCCTMTGSNWQFNKNGAWVNFGVTNSAIWRHVAVTIGEDKITTYYNGNVVTTGSISEKEIVTTLTQANSFLEIGTDFPGGDEYLTGRICDFRVYNHCLSKREIKELSKGLSLHLPLSWGAKPNLLVKSNNKFHWDYTTVTKTKGILFWMSDTMALEKGVEYTVSFDAKIDTTDSALYNGLECDLFPDSLPQRNFQFTAADGLTNQWKHFTWTTSSTNDNISSCRLRFFIDFADSVTGNTVNAPIHVKNIKLEKGNKDTPWIPPNSSSLYNTYGFDSLFMEDCSGFNRTVTKIGNGMSCSTDSPRGTGTNWSAVGKLSTSGMPTGVQPLFTINLWIRTTVDITQTRYVDVCLFNNTTQSGSSTTTRLEIENTAGSNLLWHGLNAQNLVTSPITIGEWTMHTFVSDGTKVYVYKNAVLGSSYTYTGDKADWKPTGTINIGDSASAPYYDLADFRLYSTVLSADDIKALYSVAMEIDKNGNMYCANLIEN